MTSKDFDELVLKLMSQGKNPLEAVQMAQASGLFEEKIIDAFWDDFNKRRSS